MLGFVLTALAVLLGASAYFIAAVCLGRHLKQVRRSLFPPGHYVGTVGELGEGDGIVTCRLEQTHPYVGYNPHDHYSPPL